MAAADTARLIAELVLKDKQFQVAIRNAVKGVDKVESKLSKIGSATSRGLRSAGQNLEKSIVIGTTAAGAALTYAVKSAVDWESAVAGVNKTIEATPAELKQITDGLIAMSNRMPVAAEELAAIAESAGALGVAKKDILSFTETVALLGATTNVTTDEAATALGQLQNVIGLTGDEFDNFAAALVDLGNKGASTEAQILEIARRSGGAAKLIGVAKDATLGWASAAANLGLNEELAGTALQNFFIKSQTLIAGGGKKLTEFAAISGKTAKQFKKDFDKDATGALEDFLAGLGKMPKDARIKAVQKLFGKGSGLTRLILGLSESVDKNLTPALDTATAAWADNTAATEEAEKRFKTSAAQLQTLRNNVKNASVVIGTALLPVLNELAQEGLAWLQDPQTQKSIQAFSKDLASGAREAVKWLKSLDWQAIGNALKTAGGFAKSIVEAFINAPPWVQQFLTVGFVANKFTGGALGSIIGELGKGLIKGAFNMNAGVVNLRAASVTGLPGGAAGGVAGGGKGKIATAASVLSKVFIVGMAGAVIAELLGARGAQSEANKEQITGLTAQTAVFVKGATLDQMETALAGIEQQQRELNDTWWQPEDIAYALDIDGVKTAIEAQKTAILAEISAQRSDIKTGDLAQVGITGKLDATTRSQLGGVIAQVHDAGVQGVTATSAVKSAVANVANVTRSGTNKTAAAINNKKWRIIVNNQVNAQISYRNMLTTVSQSNAVGATAS